MLLRMCLPIIVPAIRSEVKARNVLSDNFGECYTGDQKLSNGVAAWQKALQDYGKKRGLTLK
ncbi:hypothetical protein [Bifidobacterium moukalabense]|uniref:hypothetical protein n=1 Tax=Bifidobacterium moukalabense TaxID=1333651 RepID=UPI0010F62907|nr:hypothetical protein [Bifidobacterium moukalabense]